MTASLSRRAGDLRTRDYADKKFLIVDDMPFMLNLIHRMLKECGATHIYKALDGQAALKMIRDDVSQVDFIIADCNMKLLNGLQLLQAVRSGVNPRIPRDQSFVMLTGQRDVAVVKAALMLDVNGYLVKPVALDKLIEALDRVALNPITLRSPAYYQATVLPRIRSLDKLNEGDPDKPEKISAWVIMPHGAERRNRTAIKSKLEAFSVEHATRSAADPVNITHTRRCDLAELTDGMVIAEDIHADADHILLRRGAQLTNAMIDRLRELAVETGTRDFVLIGRIAG